MNAKKCDRCGKFYEIDEDRVRFGVATMDKYFKHYLEFFELCIECQNEFDYFITMNKGNSGKE